MPQVDLQEAERFCDETPPMIHLSGEASQLSYGFATMAYGNTDGFVPMTCFRRLCVLNTESGHGRFSSFAYEHSPDPGTPHER
jgi:hypothetical protein